MLGRYKRFMTIIYLDSSNLSRKMHVGGFLLITMFLANVLATEAHYCLCDCNSKSPFLHESYYSPATSAPQNLFLQHSQNLHQKIGHSQQQHFDFTEDQQHLAGFQHQKPAVFLHDFGIGLGQSKQDTGSGSEHKIAEGFEGLGAHKSGVQYAVVEKEGVGTLGTGGKNEPESYVKTQLAIKYKPHHAGTQDNDLSQQHISKVSSYQKKHYFKIEQKITPSDEETTKGHGGDSEEEKDHHHHDHDKNAYYKFEYAVNHQKTHDVKSHKEERKGDVVRGEYSLLEADGNVRTVKYYADWKSGFQAQVHNSKKKS